jgi:hypothetical protein
MLPDTALKRNLIRLSDPDLPIVRIHRMKYLRPMLQDSSLVLVSPALWDDPFENILSKCVITHSDGRQEFFGQVRKPVLGQCWSLDHESDATWRIYSTVSKDPGTGKNEAFDEEGVKLCTTARKLLSALWEGCPTEQENACFIGMVRYADQEPVMQNFANEVGQKMLKAFADGVGHAESLLFKRTPFAHENEVRLIYVENRADAPKCQKLQIRFSPANTLDKIVLDPRLGASDREERIAEIRRLGFDGPIERSGLYQKWWFEIIAD